MSGIQDIIIKRKADSMFNTYKPIKEVGENMYKSFRTMFVQGKGFPIDRGSNVKIGTISNCMGLSTFLEFLSMDIDISESSNEFLFVLKSVFDSVYRPDGSIVFDATPYITYDSSTELTTYVETMAKILIVMIDLRNYAINSGLQNKQFFGSVELAGNEVDSFSKLTDSANKLLIDCMRALCDACLRVDSAEVKPYKIGGQDVRRSGFKTEIEYRGWAFCKPDRSFGNAEDNQFDTSLYYTYHATNAFISLYNAYSDIMDYIYNGKGYDLSKLSQQEIKKHSIDEKFINDNKALIGKFRQMTASAGRYLDTLITSRGINLSFDYIQSGVKKISTERVLESQKNNYVINTLLVLAILINAGSDDDYESVGKGDYNKNQMQYTLVNIKKIYNLLKQENKADLIDSYRLTPIFADEKYPAAYADIAQKFRRECEGLIVYDLVPLMCNTYSIMFNYQICYPQREMIENLGLIMDNRAEEDNWYWDKRFNINNNLYYIVAIENFYDYYKQYELPLIKNEVKYNEAANKARMDLEQKQKEFEDLKLQLAEKERLYNEKQSELDTAVKKLAQNTFDSVFELRLENYLNKAFSELGEFSIATRNIMDSDANVKEVLNDFPKAKMLVKISDALNIPKIIQNRETSRTDKETVINNAIDEDVVLRICNRRRMDD